MRTIRLYGQLARFLGRRSFQADVASVGEAVRFLLANFPHLEPHMTQQHYRVSLDQRAIGIDEINEPSGQAAISFVPVIGGAGTVGRIIAGVALIALSFVPGFAAWAGPLAFKLIVGIGISLVTGGVAQLLTPVPGISTGDMTDNSDPRKNYSFSGIQNVSRQGVPVNIIYGEVIVGSAVISAGIDIDQVSA